ncbi:MAG: hypothetical protein SPH89_00160 [Candidatus Limisoma sp.]|nr:hypothetical protein [Candidatus Limisoma sp.]
MLTLSEAEHGVYHDRRVSDALHRHRIFDTTPMSTHPLIRSYLLPLTSDLITLIHSMACSLPQPCRRYGCGGCLGETAIMVNPTLSIGDA